MRFSAIEGLRGWLAWIVVIGHLIQFSNLHEGGGVLRFLSNQGNQAVLVFIVISGFVICNRVIQIREQWWPYIIRRFFRIYPLYFLLLLIGAALTPYAGNVFSTMPWASDYSAGIQQRFDEWSVGMANYTVAQWVLHLILLQGVVSDSLLAGTATNFLGPAWSLSLEWQFYLIAPLMIWSLTSRIFRIPIAILVAALAVAYENKFFGTYYLPSALPAAGYIFLVGIISRIWFERLQVLTLPSFTTVIFAIAIAFHEVRWLAVWAIVLVYLLNERRWTHDLIGRSLKLALSSKPAIYFGERSYSTYLVHFPIMFALMILMAPLGLSKGTAIAIFIFLTIALTAVTSHFLYRYIEQPFIRIGSRIVKRQMTVTA